MKLVSGELVGLYLLNRLIVIYKTDELAVITDANGPKLEKIRKDIFALFKEERLPITIEISLIETDFLESPSNLKNKML